MSLVAEKVVELQGNILSSKGIDLVITESETDKDLWILSNPELKRVVIMGEIDNPFLDGEMLLVAYTVDVHKWIWAESEGFTKEDIVGKLRSKVFSALSLDKMTDYLTKP